MKNQKTLFSIQIKKNIFLNLFVVKISLILLKLKLIIQLMNYTYNYDNSMSFFSIISFYRILS